MKALIGLPAAVLLSSVSFPAMVLAAAPAADQQAVDTTSGGNTRTASNSIGDATDIVVTARRVEERLQDVPISITVVSAGDISRRNITIAADLATYTPSLSVNDRYGPEKSSFSLRGFNQDNGTAPTVGVYFADVVGVRAQGGTTSGNTVGAGAFMDLQNVQVLKGPQGTLFGRNTTGGAILLVPTKPTGRLEGYVEGSIGNYDMRRVQGAINIPVADTFRVRFSGDRMKRDGYMRNRAAGFTDKYNDRSYLSLRMSVVADLTPDLENYTIVSYSHSDTNGFAARIIGCDRTALTGTRGLTARAGCEQLDRQAARGDGLYDVEIGVANPFLDLKQWQIINTTTWRATDNLTVKNIASYGEFYERSHFSLNSDNFFGPAGGFALNTISPALGPLRLAQGQRFQYIVLDTAPGQDNASQSTFTEEFQLQGNGFGNKLNYVLGGYLEFSRPIGFNAGRTGIFLNCIRPENISCTNPAFIGSISESSTKLNFDNHGIFGQASYNIFDKLSLSLGGRYTFDKIKGLGQSTRASLATAATPGAFQDIGGQFITRRCNDTFRFGAGNVQRQDQCQTRLTNKSNKPTWLVGLDYKPSEDLLVYGKYARGYRQGGINFTNPGIELWGPEKIDSYELGAKATFRGTISGYLNVSGFYNDLKQAQVFAQLIPTAAAAATGIAGGAAIVNAGQARTKGVEVDGSVLFFRSLRFTAGYTYLDTKVRSVAAAANQGDGSTLGNRLVGTPFGRIIPTVLPGSAFTLSPKHKIVGTAEYTLPLDASVGRLSFGGTVVYQTKQLITSAVNAPTDPASPYQVTNMGRNPPRTLLNVNVNWNDVAGFPVDLALFATNVTKKKYVTSIGQGYNSAGFETALVGEPRMYGARVRVKFGSR